jgi:hypothetical protein
MRYTDAAVNDRQIYTGELTNTDPISSVLARTGQESRATRDRYMREHGRFYSGLGSDVSLDDPFPGNPNAGDLFYSDNEAMDALEAEDDVAGSGIFDQPGRRSTIHSTLGVFADHPSLPGYAAREQPFAVSQDVTDPIHHADVVYLPAGGMTYVERGGRRVDYLDRGASVPPPAVHGHRHHRRTGPANGTPIAPTVPPAAEPAPTPLLMDPMDPIGTAAAAQAAQAAAASGFGDMAFARMFQPAHPVHPLPVRSIVNPIQVRQAVGQDAPPAADWKTYAAVGAIVGVGAAILIGTLKIKPGKSGRR